MKKTIKIDFINFWPGYNKTSNYFYDLLKEEFNVEISNTPDYLFYSVFGQDHKNYRCKKIFYTGENIPVNFSECDYAFSFEPIKDNNYRLPHYLLYDGYYDLVNKKVDDSLVNRKFCSFVASNPNCEKRNSFVRELSKYKKVDCGGSVYNNIGYKVPDKIKFQSEYKFSIAFENEAYRPGHEWYVTEKLFEGMKSNTIPIYYGGSKVGLEFNTKSFINCHDYNSFDDVIDRIIELDKNDDKYLEMLKEPWLPGKNKIPKDNKIENIKKFLYKIFE